MFGVAGAHDDEQVGMLLAQLGDEALGQDRFVHRQHDCRSGFDAEARKRIAARRIAEGSAVSVALCAVDQVGVGIEQHIGPVMGRVHVGNQPADASAADDDGAAFALVFLGQFTVLGDIDEYTEIPDFNPGNPQIYSNAFGGAFDSINWIDSEQNRVVTFSRNTHVVPAPGALPLLGLSLTAATRRRR